jgi:hypothetical protein
VRLGVACLVRDTVELESTPVSDFTISDVGFNTAGIDEKKNLYERKILTTKL